VLKKYKTERKVCSYHWEVVDGCTCVEGGVNVGAAYKEAPADVQLGQAMPITSEERVALANWMTADAAQRKAELAEAFQQLPELNVPQQPGPAQRATTQATATQPAAVTAKPATENKPSMFERFGSLLKSSK
jgi:hypothetical protein